MHIHNSSSKTTNLSYHPVGISKEQKIESWNE